MFTQLLARKVAAFFAASTLVFAIARSAHAEIDKESQEALEKTQALLRDPSQRSKAINDSPDAKSNDAELTKLLGGNSAGAYDLSADIFAKIVHDANGDPVAMQKKLEEAQKNPETFLKSLTPNQQAKIKEMARQAEGNRNPSGRP